MTTRVEEVGMKFKVGQVWKSVDGCRWRIVDVESKENSAVNPVKALSLEAYRLGQAMHFTPEGIWSAAWDDYTSLNLVELVEDVEPTNCLSAMPLTKETRKEIVRELVRCDPELTKISVSYMDEAFDAAAYQAIVPKLKPLIVSTPRGRCTCGMVKFGFIGHAGYCPEFQTLAQMRVALTTPDPVPDYLTPGDLKGAAQRSSK